MDLRNGEPDIYINYSTDGGATWLLTDKRIDTGDPAGANASWLPQINVYGSNVHVSWVDYRNGNADIYYNNSPDGGATWQATDFRIDTGDPSGASDSINVQMSCFMNNVCIAWEDYRNGLSDIYFNCSPDGGATWPASDTRIDTGDTPGTSDSFTPQIVNLGNNVYVVWEDYRNGKGDILFNFSGDLGETWLVNPIRLDTGDTPGTNDSTNPQMSCFTSNVHVVWMDVRNGFSDIYYNSSTNYGTSWQASDTRIDTGDNPGANDSSSPQISCFSSNAFIAWEDYRNGLSDIYFNSNGIPFPVSDIKANGSDGPITLNHPDTLTITVELYAGTYSGHEADWWLVGFTPFGWYYYHPNPGWLPGREVTLQIPLRDLPQREVLNMSGLPAGSYTFYFGVDLVKNGLINMGQAYYDLVSVTINP
jgi:hypothetical protein